MSHEIDQSRGRAAMFAVKVDVWHQSETGSKRLAYHPTSQQALAEAELDFNVIKVPTQRVLPDGRMLANKLAFSTVRDDTNQELGAVGPDYTPLQNREALAILDPLIASGHAVIETAGALRGGADIWVCIAWALDKFSDEVRAVFGTGLDGRTLLPYSVLRNNHNGRSNVVGYDTTICTVCANTLGFGLAQAGASEQEGREGKIGQYAFAVRHSKNVRENVEAAAAAMWQDRVAMFEIIAAQYRLLKDTPLPEAYFKAIVLDAAAPLPGTLAHPMGRRWNPEAKLAKVVLERAETRRAAITRAWTEGAGHSGDKSTWEAYNGAVEVIDHNVELFPTKGGVWRTQTLLDGRLGQVKQTIINRLVEYAQTTRDGGDPSRLLARSGPVALLTVGGGQIDAAALMQ